MASYSDYFKSAYKRLKLYEQDFDISKDALQGIEDWKKSETEHGLSSLEDTTPDGVETLQVVDPDAYEEEDVQDDYVGNVVLECVSCHNLITVDESKVYEDEETGTCCPDIKCPICNAELGYTVKGKIENYDEADADEEDEEKLDFPEEPEEEEEVEETEEEEVKESLQDKIRKRTFTEAKENVCPDCGQDPCVCEGEDCDNCDESCSKDESLNEAGNLHVTDQKDMKRLGSKKWNSADNKEYFDKISKDNDIYVNPDKKMGIAKNKRTGKSYKFDKDNNEIKDESLDEAKLDEKLPKSLANKKDFISNKFGSDIDFENSTFDEISPEDLANMSREDRENVFGIGTYGDQYEIGKRGQRAGKLIKHDWGKPRNTGIDVGNTAEVGRELRGSKLYKANPVAKDPEKMAARAGNEYIGKANAARKNARDSFGADPDRYSWGEPEKQRLSDIKSAQKYRNTAASEMNKRFKDPNIDDYRRTKDEVGWDKKWLGYANDDLERATDDVTSARLARDYGTRYARDVVDNEKRAKEYMDRAEQARKAGVEYMRNAPADELERAKDNLDYATQSYNRAKDSVERHEKGISDKLAAFKDRHNKRMGKNEALNEAPEGFDYGSKIVTPREKENNKINKLLTELKKDAETLLTGYSERLDKLQTSVQQAYDKAHIDLERLMPQRGAWMYCMANQGIQDTDLVITGSDEIDYPFGLSIEITAPEGGIFNAWINSTYEYEHNSVTDFDCDYDLDSIDDIEYSIDQIRLLANNRSTLENLFKEAYNNLDACIKLAGYDLDTDESLKEALNEALNNLSLDTDDQHLDISADETGRISVVAEPTGAPSEDIPNTMVPGEDSIVPLENSDMDEIEANISPEEQSEILDTAGEESSEESGEDLGLEDVGAEEAPVEEEGEEEFEVEEESFNYLGNTFAKKLYENVNKFDIVKHSYKNGKLVVEGLITFNSGVKKPTTFIFANAVKTPTNRLMFEGINTTFFPTKAFKLRGRLVEGKLVCESLRYNYSINKLNESTGKQEPVAVKGIVRGK